MDLIESMALNGLLTDVEPKITQFLRGSDPADIIIAVSRLKRELQFQQLKTQKFNHI